MKPQAPVTAIRASAYTIPTDKPEADGTLAWDKTTLVIVEAEAGGSIGLGYTYSDSSNVALIEEKLKPLVHGSDALEVPPTLTERCTAHAANMPLVMTAQ